MGVSQDVWGPQCSTPVRVLVPENNARRVFARFDIRWRIVEERIGGFENGGGRSGETIGRGMKVNKEEVLGMLAALELYLSRDHDAEWKVWEDQINMIADAAKSVGDVETKISVPEYANCVPTLRIKWDQKKN